MIVGSVVDAHHHLWDLTHNNYPWLTGKSPVGLDVTPFAHDYHVDDYLRDAAGVPVGRSVHVQAGWDTADPVGETRWLTEVAEREGYPHAIVAHADLSAENAGEELRAHASSPLVRGVRMLLTWHPEARYRRAARPDFLSDPAWQRGLGMLGDLGLSFDMQIYPLQMTAAVKVVQAFPAVRFIVDHMGLPIETERPRAWEEGIRRLADHPNVAIKLSGFSHLLSAWNRETARPLVETVMSAFGPERCLFGSNYPVERPFVEFRALVEDIALILADQPERTVERMFCRNAVEWYRLDA